MRGDDRPERPGFLVPDHGRGISLAVDFASEQMALAPLLKALPGGFGRIDALFFQKRDDLGRERREIGGEDQIAWSRANEANIDTSAEPACQDTGAAEGAIETAGRPERNFNPAYRHAVAPHLRADRPSTLSGAS